VHNCAAPFIFTSLNQLSTYVPKEEQEMDEEIERMEIFIQKGMKFRLGVWRNQQEKREFDKNQI
jgi:hypothetical protein